VTSAGVRGRAAGVAVARQIAERFDLPFVDLRSLGVVATRPTRSKHAPLFGRALCPMRSTANVSS
jgi:hypothetical protein